MRTAGIVQECMGQKGSRPEFVNPPHVKPPLKAELSLSVWLFCGVSCSLCVVQWSDLDGPSMHQGNQTGAAAPAVLVLEGWHTLSLRFINVVWLGNQSLLC
eukprot:1160133-Pelagomonas_calceolata.AAC.9